MTIKTEQKKDDAINQKHKSNLYSIRIKKITSNLLFCIISQNKFVNLEKEGEGSVKWQKTV